MDIQHNKGGVVIQTVDGGSPLATAVGGGETARERVRRQFLAVPSRNSGGYSKNPERLLYPLSSIHRMYTTPLYQTPEHDTSYLHGANPEEQQGLRELPNQEGPVQRDRPVRALQRAGDGRVL